MKTLRFFLTFAVILAVCMTVSASETSDNFAKWVPDFASQDLDKRKNAQQNWQDLCRHSGSDAALRKEIIKLSVEQLGKENPVDTAVWIVRQLGIAGDASAVPTLAKLLTDSEVRIQNEAAAALANIPGSEAAAALKANSSQSAKDAITARSIKANIPKPAIEKNMPQAIPYSGNVEVGAWMKGYNKLSDIEKAQTLSNLTARIQRTQVSDAQALRRTQIGQRVADRRAERQSSQYLPLAIEAAKSSDETLRDAGLLAVSALGGIKEVSFLLEQAREGSNKNLAKLALSRMSGREIDAVLIADLKSEKDNEKFLVLADVLNRRFNSDVRPIFLEKAKAADAPNRLQLLQFAESLSSKADIGDFVKAWELITDRGQKNQAEQVIARLVNGDSEPVLQVLPAWDTPDGLSLLGRISDPKTVDKIKGSKDALRAWSNWADAKVADDLFAIAGDDKYSEEDRITALRAFVRVMSLPNDRIGIRIGDADKVKRLASAFDLAKRVDDKRLIIERVGQIRHPDSLRFILKFFDEPELQDRVCGSILDLAHHVDLKRSAKDEFNAALDKVLSVTKNQWYLERAKRYKDQQ